MKQSTKKTLKKLVWLTPAVVSLGISAGSFVQFGLNTNKEIELSKANNKIYEEVIASEKFHKFEEEYRVVLYEAYKSGAITASEYDTKLKVIREYDRVWDNREFYMSSEHEAALMANAIQINELLDSSTKNAMLSLGGIGASALFGCGYALTRGKNEEQTKGSIMSQCSYSDILEEKDM